MKNGNNVKKTEKDENRFQKDATVEADQNKTAPENFFRGRTMVWRDLPLGFG
jgi:hypothetical protein